MNRFARYSYCYVLWCPWMTGLRLTMPVKGRWARDALIHTFDINDFKCNTNNSTETRHIHNESANLIESYDVVWTPWFGRISILNEGSKVWSHTFAFVTHVITWRRKYVAFYGKSMSSPAKFPRGMLWYINNPLYRNACFPFPLEKKFFMSMYARICIRTLESLMRRFWMNYQWQYIFLVTKRWIYIYI